MTDSKQQPSRKRKFYLIYFTCLLAFSASAAEVIPRLTGHHPWVVKPADIRVDPGGRLYRANPTLGFSHLPGQFKITLNGAYTYTTTNLSNTLRITHPLNTYPAPAGKKEIWIFGDSITYGQSVNDEDTFSWLLQFEQLYHKEDDDVDTTEFVKVVVHRNLQQEHSLTSWAQEDCGDDSETAQNR